jgi:hypothetical protein
MRKKQGRVTEERMQEIIFSLLGIPDPSKATPEAWERAAAALDLEIALRKMFYKNGLYDPKNTLGRNAEMPVNATFWNCRKGRKVKC